MIQRSLHFATLQSRGRWRDGYYSIISIVVIPTAVEESFQVEEWYGSKISPFRCTPVEKTLARWLLFHHQHRRHSDRSGEIL
jgi:hypothetical protein